MALPADQLNRVPLLKSSELSSSALHAIPLSSSEVAHEFRGDIGLDPGGFAGMTAPHLCEHENWPGHGPEVSGRRPTPYLLALLAAVYGCAITDLIDLADREHLPQADLLILDKYSQPRVSRTAVEPASQPESGPPAILAALPFGHINSVRLPSEC